MSDKGSRSPPISQRPRDDSDNVRTVVKKLDAIAERVENVHTDVHGVRKDFRDAIERGTTAVMNRLSLLEAKIDKIFAGGISPEERAALAELIVEGERITRKVEALNAER